MSESLAGLVALGGCKRGAEDTGCSSKRHAGGGGARKLIECVICSRDETEVPMRDGGGNGCPTCKG